MTPKLVNILVGGRSTEHDASLHSYEHVLSQIVSDSTGRLAIAGVYYIALDGGVHPHRAAPWPSSAAELAAPEAEVLLDIVAELARSEWPVFSLLHGNEGEDGGWQGLAQIVGLQGTFGPVLTSALAMSKFHMSLVATSIEMIRMPRTVFLDAWSTDADLETACGTLGSQPSVVKPNNMGASLFTSYHDVLDLGTLKRIRQELLPYDPEMLVQEYVNGDEYTAGCLEAAGEVIALPIIKAVTARGFLGHEEKHRSGMVRPEILPADTDLSRRISDVSKNLFRRFRFLGFCRFDYIVGSDGGLYFLEANALPGLMSGSAYTLMLKTAGYGMIDLIEYCVDAARARPIRQTQLRYNIDH